MEQVTFIPNREIRKGKKDKGWWEESVNKDKKRNKRGRRNKERVDKWEHFDVT